MSLLKKVKVEAIIKEAKKLFLQKGIEGVTMADLASHLSIGEASLYRYFGKKQKLMIEAGILIWEELLHKIQEVPVHSSGYENIKEFYNFFLKVFEDNIEFFRFVSEFDLKIVQENISNEELKEYEQIVLKFKERFDQYFQLGLKDGTIKDTIDANIVYYSTTHALLSLCKKLATQPRLLEYEYRIKQKEQIICLIEIYLHYIKN